MHIRKVLSFLAVYLYALVHHINAVEELRKESLQSVPKTFVFGLKICYSLDSGICGQYGHARIGYDLFNRSVTIHIAPILFSLIDLLLNERINLHALFFKRAENKIFKCLKLICRALLDPMHQFV